MTEIEKTLDQVVNKPCRQNDGDYLDQEGFLMCCKCHTRKQKEIAWLHGKTKKIFCPCKCEAEKLCKEEENTKRLDFLNKITLLRKDGITDPAYLRFTFKNDDGANPKITMACKQYVEQWEKMRAKNIGILFYGSVGTGKSFFASCIANALLDQCVSAAVTNFPTILNLLQDFSKDSSRQNIIQNLLRYELLVIDDLGVERSTPYAAEQIFNIIDSRVRSNKPMIITTNLSLNQMQEVQDITAKRIYDRIFEACPIPIRMVGESRRVNNAQERKNLARQLLNNCNLEGE